MRVKEIICEPMAGTSISSCVDEALELANKHGCVVKFTFNDQLMIVKGGGNAGQIVEEYFTGFKKAADAIKPTNGDWIEWNGGENPVPGKRVNVKFRNGTIDEDRDREKSELWVWPHVDSSYDIIAYQVVD